MEQNDFDILVPRTVKINLLGRAVEVAPLSIKAAVQLGRVLGRMHGQIKDMEPGQNAGGANVLAQILQNADGQSVAEIINLLTQNAFADIQNIDEKLNLHDLSALAKAVGEVNDFALVAANFTAALGGGGNAPRSQAR